MHSTDTHNAECDIPNNRTLLQLAAHVSSPNFTRPSPSLASLGFAQNFGSGGEAEGLHFVRVLSLGEEFREDVALGGIHEKFWPAVA